MPSPSILSGPSGLRARAALALAAAALSLALVDGAAHAADPPEVRQARELFRNGEAAFKAGRFQDAYRAWEEGYKLTPRPLFLLNMAHAERRRGELAGARTLYKRYLLMEPETPLRGEVESVLQEIDSTLGAEAPLNAPAPLPLSVAPPPAPEAPLVNLQDTAPPPRSPVYKQWWFWTGVGGAVVAGVLGVVLLRGGDSYARNGSLGTIGMPR
jgi:hypothetical protein